jgi:hypothetical protein
MKRCERCQTEEATVGYGGVSYFCFECAPIAMPERLRRDGFPFTEEDAVILRHAIAHGRKLPQGESLEYKH